MVIQLSESVIDRKNAVEMQRLKTELKQLVVEECDTDFSADEIEDEEYLLGSAGRLQLDSLDALQISMAVQKKYGKRIEGGNESRLALTSINTLADFILA